MQYAATKIVAFVNHFQTIALWHPFHRGQKPQSGEHVFPLFCCSALEAALSAVVTFALQRARCAVTPPHHPAPLLRLGSPQRWQQEVRQDRVHILEPKLRRPSQFTTTTTTTEMSSSPTVIEHNKMLHFHSSAIPTYL